nr:MAG: hypothetical protein A2W84_08005 [Bacteroidetes bacterium GWC2_40_13]OFX76087.1 MAG: hypothetical protein A2W96_01410 [Bacteroidetes bacterium GWD2_40_43]OFX94299.1 MAG: hypothetical protein A2W97_19210 [Bacteroidetes bacterium GWE2_40_63]OFY18778.1 MAG: hypothetical protein A2W88_05975 [Bacteroidetes bacterium GWF2_40_13]HBX85212.1 hypothetical protein [Marinilabiliales bacterium]
MKRIILPFCLVILLLQCGITLLQAQIKDIGLPFISNYPRETYNAETQNWCITQDDNNVMYFANNSGVLTFDGTTWQLFPLPNNSIVRSVLFVSNRVYAGGYNEFGYFEKDAKGDMNYVSLSAHLSKEFSSFDEVWRIHASSYGIVFQSYTNIFIIKDNDVKVLEPKSRFGFSYLVNNTLYVVDREFGLYSIENGKLVPVFLNETLFLDNDVTFILQGKKHELLIGTTNSGIFDFHNNELRPWGNKVNEVFIKNQTYTGLELNQEQIAIGTIQNGIYIINKDGNVVQHLNRSRGLQNNTVLSMYFDNYKNLWLGLDNGIDMLEVSAPITILNYSYDIETSYTSIIHNNILYIGTNQGLFAKPTNEIDNEHLLDSKFTKIPGTLGQVWKLKMVDGKLWCGHNFGTFLIEDFKAVPISQIPGGWDFIEVPWEEGYVIGGNYSGLELFKKNSSTSKWESLGAVKGIHESCRELMFDENHNLWISHGLKGVFKVTLSSDFKNVIGFHQYDSKDGLPEIPYSLISIKNQFCLLANDSLFNFNASRGQFEFNQELTSMFTGIKGISHLIVESSGDIWFFTRTGMGVFRLMEDGTYIKVTNPFMRVQKLFISGSFENVYSHDKNNTFIGSKEGMLHYSLGATKAQNIKYHTYISEIKIKTRNKETEELENQLTEQRINLEGRNANISYKYNSISFKFYTPFYEAANQIRHSYRLVGFDEEWSDWNDINFKEYTNLKEGKYTFEVKAKNIYETESVVYKYPFTVKPPIYRSLVAYIFYIVAFITSILVNLIYYKHKIEKTRRIEKQKHSMELVSKEQQFKEEVKQSEEKIEQLEQEKLKSEMRHKNMELANSTMNLIQKNKLLNSLKKELLVVSEKAKSDAVKQDLKQITIRIDSTMKNDQNYKVFDKYFERVHQDFITRLKERHPELTPKEIRLCAYLRMNLSTKEIAPLINVSIRGLEISRYRLRKKLDLERDVNLIDYIMKV